MLCLAESDGNFDLKEFYRYIFDSIRVPYRDQHKFGTTDILADVGPGCRRILSKIPTFDAGSCRVPARNRRSHRGQLGVLLGL